MWGGYKLKDVGGSFDMGLKSEVNTNNNVHSSSYSCFLYEHVVVVVVVVVWGPFLRAALHLEAGPIPLEADCMKPQPLFSWRLTSTTHYNNIITGVNIPICKGLRCQEAKSIQ
jgi:hypothetical protein